MPTKVLSQEYVLRVHASLGTHTLGVLGVEELAPASFVPLQPPHPAYVHLWHARAHVRLGALVRHLARYFSDHLSVPWRYKYALVWTSIQCINRILIIVHLDAVILSGIGCMETV